MSHTEIHYGKLRKIAIHTSVEEHCESLCALNGITEKQSYNTWVEEVKDIFYEKYVIVGEDIYEIIEHEETDDGDYFNRLTPNPDGTFSFFTIFYNGGTCLTEEIEDGIKNLNARENGN